MVVEMGADHNLLYGNFFFITTVPLII